MADATASEAIHTPARQSSRQWQRHAVFILCASLYLLPFMRIIFTGTDEGSFLYGAERIVHGQVFARDFFEVIGPGSFYWLAAFFKLFGVTFLASRICLFISSLGTGILLYFLTLRVCNRYNTLPCLIMAATYMGMLWPGISHHVDSNFSGLMSVACMVLWHDKPRRSLLIAAGCLAGATTWIHLPKGVLLLCAILIWVWLQRRRTSSPFLASDLIVGAYVGIGVIVLAYFWSQGALGSLIYANFTFLHQNYNTANSVSYAYGILKFYWTPRVMAFSSRWLLGIAAVLILPFVFIAALPAFILVVGLQTKWRCLSPELVLYWLCGWALFISEFHRKDIQHLVFGSPLLVIICVQALTESRRKLAEVALQALAISAVCLAALNCFVVLAAEAHTSVTRAGTVAVSGSDDLLMFLNERVKPGEEILLYPYCPTYYFLSATTNPTPYSLLIYNYNTREQFQEVVGILERRRVRYVIWFTAFLPAAEKEHFWGSQPVSPDDLIVEPYLESHYKVIEDKDNIRIMERKDEDPAK